MTLALDDTRWNDLDGSYGGTADVVAWLAEAYAQGGLSAARLGDLINEVQHQGGTSTAMYAVAPHLVALAREVRSEDALAMLIAAGAIHADSDGPDAIVCPEFLAEDFQGSAVTGSQMLAPLLLHATTFEEFRYGVAALAGFLGHGGFGRLLMSLDLFEGRFYLVGMDEPLPVER